MEPSRLLRAVDYSPRVRSPAARRGNANLSFVFDLLSQRRVVSFARDEHAAVVICSEGFSDLSPALDRFGYEVRSPDLRIVGPSVPARARWALRPFGDAATVDVVIDSDITTPCSVTGESVGG